MPGRGIESLDVRQPLVVLGTLHDLLEQRGQCVVGDDLSVRGDITFADAIAIAPPHFVGIEVEERGDFFDDVLHGGHGLGAAKAAKRRVRRKIRSANRSGKGGTREIVGVLGVEQRPLHDG